MKSDLPEKLNIHETLGGSLCHFKDNYGTPYVRADVAEARTAEAVAAARREALEQAVSSVRAYTQEALKQDAVSPRARQLAAEIGAELSARIRAMKDEQP